jgi:hypothetical protein
MNLEMRRTSLLMQTNLRSNITLFLLRLRSVLQTGTALMHHEWLQAILFLLMRSSPGELLLLSLFLNPFALLVK